MKYQLGISRHIFVLAFVLDFLISWHPCAAASVPSPFPCANMSNNPTVPFVLSSNTDILSSDCNTALASWSEASALQIHLAPLDGTTILENIRLELVGSPVLPNISIAANLTVLSNVTIVLDGLLPGRGVVGSLQSLSYALVQWETRGMNVSHVNLMIQNSSLVAVRGSSLPCFLCFNVSKMASITIQVRNVILPTVTTLLATVSLVSLVAQFGIVGLDVSVNNLTPMYVSSGTFTMAPVSDELDAWILDAAFPFGNILNVSMQFYNITLPSSRAAVRLETGNPSSNPTRTSNSSRGVCHDGLERYSAA
jgi:hypothetical protein